MNRTNLKQEFCKTVDKQSVFYHQNFYYGINFDLQKSLLIRFLSKYRSIVQIIAPLVGSLINKKIVQNFITFSISLSISKI